MGFLDSLSKTLTSGVDRAKFEADKFQRTSRISGEINNINSQIETNIRQLGERALELYQNGVITAPEIASLAQIIAQLRDQNAEKERELNAANDETFEAWQANPHQGQQATPAQSVPLSSEPGTSYTPSGTYSSSGSAGGFGAAGSEQSAATPSLSSGRAYNIPESTDISGTGLPNTGSVGGQGGAQAATDSCPTCGYSVPGTAAFCPNCGNRIARV